MERYIYIQMMACLLPHFSCLSLEDGYLDGIETAHVIDGTIVNKDDVLVVNDELSNAVIDDGSVGDVKANEVMSNVIWDNFTSY